MAAAVLLAACESSESKAKRLNQERLTACFAAEMEAKRYSVTPYATPETQAKCDVATREWNKFMSGR